MDVASLKGYDEYSWMWGDAGTGLLGHGLAEMDLLRWSEWKNSAATIRDLEAFTSKLNEKRPVEMIGIHSHGQHVDPRPNLGDVRGRSKMHFESIQEAIHYLSLHRSDYSWMWGDAGTHLLGHRMAEMDPFRWSPWESKDTIIEDLEANRREENMQRPVEVKKDGQSKVTFANLDQAISYLEGQKNIAGQDVGLDPVPVPAPMPVQAPSPSLGASNGDGLGSGNSAESRVYLTDSTVHLLLTALVLIALTVCGCLGFFFLKGKMGAGQGIGDEDHSDDEAMTDTSPLKASSAPLQAMGPDAAQACRGAGKGASMDAALQRLLDDVQKEEGNAALLDSPASPSSKKEAVQEVERILATRDMRALLGDGTVVEQKLEFRRLVRLLHPDKGLVAGERANLALRRLVEYRSLVSSSA